MSFLVLTRAPRFGELADWLGSAAACVVVTSRRPDMGIPPTGTFRHVETVPDDDASVCGLAIGLGERYAVRRIGSLNEVDVLRAAAARHALGLDCQNLSSAVA